MTLILIHMHGKKEILIDTCLCQLGVNDQWLALLRGFSPHETSAVERDQCRTANITVTSSIVACRNLIVVGWIQN